MLLQVSMAVIVLLSSYAVYYTYQKREKLTCMVGMMIAMTIGMMTSIGTGVVLGILLQHDLTKSTIISVLLGMVVGYLAGKPISLMAAMDGMMAGIMGGMMGAMLGVMIFCKSPELMVLFVDFLFIVMMFMLLKMIDEESGATKKKETSQPMKKPLIANPLFLIVLFALIAMLVFGKSALSKGETTTPYTPPISSQSEIQGDFQTATITVGPSGYGPNNITLAAGKPTKINFKAEAGAGCLRQVVSQELGINTILSASGDNFVNVGKLQPGTYHYTCGMGMFGGTITVR